jgi:hypothetical protein
MLLCNFFLFYVTSSLLNTNISEYAFSGNTFDLYFAFLQLMFKFDIHNNVRKVYFSLKRRKLLYLII